MNCHSNPDATKLHAGDLAISFVLRYASVPKFYISKCNTITLQQLVLASLCLFLFIFSVYAFTDIWQNVKYFSHRNLLNYCELQTWSQLMRNRYEHIWYMPFKVVYKLARQKDMPSSAELMSTLFQTDKKWWTYQTLIQKKNYQNEGICLLVNSNHHTLLRWKNERNR